MKSPENHPGHPQQQEEQEQASSSSSSSADLDFTDDDLFFGTSTVLFRVCRSGASFAFDDSEILEFRSLDPGGSAAEQHRVQSLITRSTARLQPLAALGSDYSTTVVPAVPALDFVVRSRKQLKRLAHRSLPSVLKRPLLKIPNRSRRVERLKKQEQLEGISSGARSALLRAPDGTWYRLKGCGNEDQGFVFSTVRPDHWNVTLRGAAFRHTTLRELKSSLRVQELLSPLGFRCANQPIAWWEYDLPDTPLPKIRRCCIVQKTLGDRRLGDHVLNGLEQLIPILIPPRTARKLEKKLNEQRYFGEGWIRNTWMAALEVSLEGSSGRGFVDCTSLHLSDHPNHSSSGGSSSGAGHPPETTNTPDQNTGQHHPKPGDGSSEVDTGTSAAAAGGGGVGSSSSSIASLSSSSSSSSSSSNRPPWHYTDVPESLVELHTYHTKLLQQVHDRRRKERDQAPQPSPLSSINPKFSRLWKENSRNLNAFFAAVRLSAELSSQRSASELSPPPPPYQPPSPDRQDAGGESAPHLLTSTARSEPIIPPFAFPSSSPAVSTSLHSHADSEDLHLRASFSRSSACSTYSTASADRGSTAGKPSSSSSSAPTPLSMLLYLYWRLGREMGVILRAFRQNRVLWGTYSDFAGQRCNAHANNAVLLPQSFPGDGGAAAGHGTDEEEEEDNNRIEAEKPEKGVETQNPSEPFAIPSTVAPDCAAHNPLPAADIIGTPPGEESFADRMIASPCSCAHRSPSEVLEDFTEEERNSTIFPSTKHCVYLAPLDLDMAYSESEFVDLHSQPKEENLERIAALLCEDSESEDSSDEEDDFGAEEEEEEDGEEEQEEDETTEIAEQEKSSAEHEEKESQNGADQRHTESSHEENQDSVIRKKLWSHKFAEYSEIEWNSLKLSLAGFPDMSSGVTRQPSLPNSSYRAIQTALRDTLLAGFMNGLRNEVDLHPADPEMYAASYHLLKLSLIVTSDVTTHS